MNAQDVELGPAGQDQPQPRAHQGCGDAQHLTHARAAAGSLVADHQHVPLLDAPGLHRGEGFVLGLEDPRVGKARSRLTNLLF